MSQVPLEHTTDLRKNFFPNMGVYRIEGREGYSKLQTLWTNWEWDSPPTLLLLTF